MNEITQYTDEIKSEFSFSEIEKIVNAPNKLRILAIGDTIIDQYTFVEQRGRAIKDPILSVKHKYDEFYAGGILAIANHLSSFVSNITVMSLIGDQNPMIDFIEKTIAKNIDLKLFTRINAPTTIKRRFIDSYNDTKLFKIEHIDDTPIGIPLANQVINEISDIINQYDLVILGDYGHGFITEAIKRRLELNAKYLAMNVQTNSSNMGYNLFNLYSRFDFITLNEIELRLPLFRRFEKNDDVISEAYKKYKLNNFLVTHGRGGCSYIHDGKIYKAPILIRSVRDTVGSGDAVFSISALCAYCDTNPKLLPFIANSAGGIAANIIGNKESVTKEKLLKFIRGLYEEGMGRL